MVRLWIRRKTACALLPRQLDADPIIAQRPLDLDCR
jgi:hypothetical protein